MDIKTYITSKDKTVMEVMDLINQNARGVVYVCEDLKLKGIVTDGIIRRHILTGGDLDASVSEIMHTDPMFLRHADGIDRDAFMRANKITSVPVLNDKDEIITIRFLNAETVHTSSDLNAPVVIMAGGKGERLKPITQILPKPLVSIDNRTITEVIMDGFLEFGCNDFNMIVNYKKDLIKAFFQSNEKGYNVRFTDETEYRGTAGGLKLLEGMYDNSFFMTNCDIFVDEDYGQIMKHHKENNDIITLVCALKEFTVPYGTIELSEDGSVKGLTEKPSNRYMVNTGFYVIDPRFLEYIPDNTFIHITEVIEKCIAAGETVGVYPISENNWWDMGQIDELKTMRDKFNC